LQVMLVKQTKKWVVLATGGTIAGTAASAQDHTGYTAGQLSVQDVLASVPGMDECLQGDVLHAEQVAQLDSKDMNHATWQALALRCAHWLAQPDVGGLVITHGTDTLEETAWFLQRVLPTDKPVVMTCAMRPATALAPDGPQNVLDALAVVRHAAASGVVVVCAGQVHAAGDVQKTHPYRLDAFGSGDAGPLGFVEQGRVRWVRCPAPGAVHPQAPRVLSLPVAQWPWVALLHSHAGADARSVQALCDAGVRGLVVAATGNGTVHKALLLGLKQAQDRGVWISLTTRCTHAHLVGDGFALPRAQAGLNPYKARVNLLLDLLGDADPDSTLP
jgi:L-asparaginase